MPGSALDLLTGDAQTFLTKVWASRVHLHRTDPEHLVGLLSMDDADALLTSSAIRTPSVRVARDGAVLPESAYTRGATLAGKPLTGLVDSRKALALFDGGATIVFQGLHRYWPPLTRLVAELELELGHPCQANAYLTPPGSQGFAVHSDAHDVFVFQTAGSKRWEVHSPDGSGDPDDVL
ncbi:MAG: cupin domain-containing protein, partial [Nocardioides sp.]